MRQDEFSVARKSADVKLVSPTHSLRKKPKKNTDGEHQMNAQSQYDLNCQRHKEVVHLLKKAHDFLFYVNDTRNCVNWGSESPN
jgi:hypothetical protein